MLQPPWLSRRKATPTGGTIFMAIGSSERRTTCGCSSSGRAPPCQGGGSEFEPRHPLQKNKERIAFLVSYPVPWPSGKAKVCKTFTPQFKSGRHLQKKALAKASAFFNDSSAAWICEQIWFIRFFRRERARPPCRLCRCSTPKSVKEIVSKSVEIPKCMVYNKNGKPINYYQEEYISWVSFLFAAPRPALSLT